MCAETLSVAGSRPISSQRCRITAIASSRSSCAGMPSTFSSSA
jgi:hypothetical protein